MTRPLGVFASLDAGLGLQLDLAGELGVPTIHLHSPHANNRSESSIKSHQERLRKLGLKVSVLFAGFEGESYESIPTVKETVGFAPKSTRNERVLEFKEIAKFAVKLSANDISYTGQTIPVGMHLGFIEEDTNSQDFAELASLTQELCDHCATNDQAIHLETGQESADGLLAFLEAVDRTNLFVNFDPANMILYGSGDPMIALRKLGPYLKSVHCKDAIASDQPGITWGRETPLGEGEVDFQEMLAILDELLYLGPLTIERETPEDPLLQKSEIQQAINLLESVARTP